MYDSRRSASKQNKKESSDENFAIHADNKSDDSRPEKMAQDLGPKDNEKDVRLRYLLKHGKVTRCHDNYESIFAELPQIPGVWIFYRKESVRAKSPEILEFGNCQLNHVPLMEGEEELTKLVFSNNSIQKIENLVSLKNLLSISFSHNLLSKIGNGFENVKKLKLIDLSYNFIENIEGLEHLDQLDDLNLSHNKISNINPLGQNRNLV